MYIDASVSQPGNAHRVALFRKAGRSNPRRRLSRAPRPHVAQIVTTLREIVRDRQTERPTSAATSAARTSSIPDARPKLIALSLLTPSASSTPAVAETFATAPPEGIGRTDAAAPRQRTTRASAGEKSTPSAASNVAEPMALVVQQESKNTVAIPVERPKCVRSLIRTVGRRYRADRRRSGSSWMRLPATRMPKQITPKQT